SASRKDATPLTSSPVPFKSPRLAEGTTARSNPSRSASFSRAAIRCTRRSSPPSPSSPTNTVRGSAGRSRNADATATASPRSAAGSRFQEDLRRIGDLAKATLGHLEDADLVRGSEAVLRRAQDAERVEALALEIEDRVDDVLEDARPRDRALLRDVANEEDRHVLPLREFEEPRRALPQLRHPAGGRDDRVRVHRLDRVDDSEDGPHLANRLDDRAEIGLRENQDAVAGDAESTRSHLDLVRRRRARYIEDGALGRERGRRLHQKGALSDA